MVLYFVMVLFLKVLLFDKYNFRGLFGLSDAGDAFLEIFGEDNENPVAYLGETADENGEMMFQIYAKSKSNKSDVSMMIDPNGGRFDATNKLGENVAFLGVGNKGGGSNFERQTRIQILKEIG